MRIEILPRTGVDGSLSRDLLIRQETDPNHHVTIPPAYGRSQRPALKIARTEPDLRLRSSHLDRPWGTCTIDLEPKIAFVVERDTERLEALQRLEAERILAWTRGEDEPRARGRRGAVGSTKVR